jgi:hypothetical protein
MSIFCVLFVRHKNNPSAAIFCVCFDTIYTSLFVLEPNESGNERNKIVTMNEKFLAEQKRSSKLENQYTKLSGFFLPQGFSLLRGPKHMYLKRLYLKCHSHA